MYKGKKIIFGSVLISSAIALSSAQAQGVSDLGLGLTKEPAKQEAQSAVASDETDVEVNSANPALAPEIPAPSIEILSEMSKKKGNIALLQLTIREKQLLNDLHEAEIKGHMIERSDPSNDPSVKNSGGDTDREINQIGDQDAKEEPLPVVKSISGVGGELEATVSVFNAGTFTVGVNDDLPNAIRVLEITPTSVTIYSGLYNAKKRLGIGERHYSSEIDQAAPQPAIPLFQ